MVIGRSGKRILSIVLAKEKNSSYYVVTARDADKKDLADYWGKFKDIDLAVELTKPRNETLILRMPKSQKLKLQNIAESKGLKVSTLVRIWLAERLCTA